MKTLMLCNRNRCGVGGCGQDIAELYQLVHSQNAEKRLCGTVSADKNEILFNEFNINYNNEPDIFKRGTLLIRKMIMQDGDRSNIVVVDVHDDMLKETFWKKHSEILLPKYKNNIVYEGPITDLINEQLLNKEREYYGFFIL